VRHGVGKGLELFDRIPKLLGPFVNADFQLGVQSPTSSSASLRSLISLASLRFAASTCLARLRATMARKTAIVRRAARVMIIAMPSVPTSDGYSRSCQTA